MAHSLPPTPADRFIADLEDNHSMLSDLPSGGLDITDAGLIDTLVRSNLRRGFDFAALDPAVLLDLAESEPSFLAPHDLALYSRWRDSRYVYRFDGYLSTALGDTPLQDDAPMSLFGDLPHPALFVEAPTKAYLTSGQMVPFKGFFAFIENMPVEGSEDTIGSGVVVLEPHLTLMTVGSKLVYRTTIHLPLPGRTVGDAVAEVYRTDMALEDRLGDRAAFIADSFEERSRYSIVRMLNHLLYIMAADCESEVVFAPSGKGLEKNQRRRCRSQIISVGENIGDRLRTYTVKQAESGGIGDLTGTWSGLDGRDAGGIFWNPPAGIGV